MAHEEEENMLIVSDDQVMQGNPIIKGTQITVEQILLEFAHGLSLEQVLNKYPQLTSESVKAALKFAAESVRYDHVTSDGSQS